MPPSIPLTSPNAPEQPKVDVISLYDFTHKEELFHVKVKHFGKEYVVNFASLFDEILFPTGEVNSTQATKLCEFACALRVELSTITDDLTKELNGLSLTNEIFMAERTAIAESDIREEREKLVEQKLKKEIGQITAAQILNYIIEHYREDYETMTNRLDELKRNLKSLERLDRILEQRIYVLKDYKDSHNSL